MTRTMLGVAVGTLLLLSGSATTWAQADQTAPPVHSLQLTLDGPVKGLGVFSLDWGAEPGLATGLASGPPNEGVPPPGPFTQPGPVSTRPPARYPRKGLMLTGWIMLASSYIVTVVTGAMDMRIACITMEKDDPGGSDDSDCQWRGKLMLIPLVGPWMAMKETGAVDGKLGLAMLGVGQGLGLVLGIVGTVIHIADKRRFTRVARGVPLGGRWALNVTTVRSGPAPAPVLQLSTLLR